MEQKTAEQISFVFSLILFVLSILIILGIIVYNQILANTCPLWELLEGPCPPFSINLGALLFSIIYCVIPIIVVIYSVRLFAFKLQPGEVIGVLILYGIFVLAGLHVVFSSVNLIGGSYSPFFVAVLSVLFILSIIAVLFGIYLFGFNKDVKALFAPKPAASPPKVS